MNVAQLSDHPDFKLPNTNKLDGISLLREGKMLEAERLLRKVTDDEEVVLHLASFAFQAERYEQGLELLEPFDSMQCKVGKAAFHEALGNVDKGIELLLEVVKEDISILDVLAKKLADHKRFDDVVALLEGRDDLSFKARMILGEAYVSCSELGEAKAMLDSIVEEQPEYVYAYLLMESVSKDASFLEPQIPLFLEALDSFTVTKEVCNNIHHVLGKVYEDLGNYEESLYHYSACAKEEQKIHTYNDTTAAVDVLIKTYTKDFVKRHTHPEPVNCPLVFILGMPRSGTTLTEQILISHSQVETRGETINAGNALDDILTGANRPESPKEALEMYLERVGEIKGTHVIDKMPANYRFIGAIHVLFPKAKFIHVKRDALDNCFSCFTTQFLEGHDYSYDFNNLASEYHNYERLMGLWHEVLPSDCIIDVNYEDMVANQQKESTRLLNFLGLDWEDSCGEFYKLKRNVQTASLAQVVQPIYKSSLNRAGKYGDLLKPLQEALDDVSRS